MNMDENMIQYYSDILHKISYCRNIIPFSERNRALD